MSKVVFIQEPNNSIWLRDYGPHFIWQDGARAIADSHYYPSRPLDNFVPTLLGEDFFQIPVYAMGLYYSGGNFQAGPNRWGFCTSLINQDNPGFSQTYIEQLYNQYQGIDTLHIFPKLPNSVDGTGHIDMWMYLVDSDDVIISQFKPGSNATAIEITDNATAYMQGLGYTVSRTPAWNVGWTHYTYTNAFRVNDRIFVPIYGLGNPNYLDEDAAAMAAWQAAAGPSVTLVPIDCYDIIPAAGAIHCIVMQVPEHSATTPSAVVCSPVGGELLASGATHDVQWGASDDQSVTMVDLAYSTDSGATFPNPIAYGEPNDGHFAWTVPALDTTQAAVQVTAHDGSGNQASAQSPAPFEIAQKPQRVYDFSTGANADKWGWGYRSSSWADVDAQRYPATASTPIDQLDPNAYAKIAASDATGGDNDPNRYVGSSPGSGKETTHVFEFVLTEPPSSILDLGIDWEGYGDQCIQMELYVWDEANGNWSDTKGLTGENMYCANYAGNRDDDLTTHIRSNLANFVDPQDGRLTMLLYGERPGQRSFHDFLAVTVTHDDCQADLGFLGPGGGILSVCGAALATGNTADLWLRNVPAGTPVWMFFGTTANPKPFAGGSIVPWPPLVVGEGAADGSGQVYLPGLNGGGGPASFTVQFVYLDPSQPQGFGFSNAIRLDYLP